MLLSFYDHHRQSYGHMPISVDRAAAEFMVGDYGEPDDDGVHDGGEFAIYLVNLVGNRRDFARTHMSPYLRVFADATGALRAFLGSGAWDRICEADERREIRTRDDLTALLIAGGLSDRSDHPIGHEPVCNCCGRATEPAS